MPDHALKRQSPGHGSAAVLSLTIWSMASASSTSSGAAVAFSSQKQSSQTASTFLAMSLNPMRLFRKRRDHDFIGGIEHGRHGRRPRAARPWPTRSAGNRSRSGFSNVKRADCRRDRGGAPWWPRGRARRGNGRSAPSCRAWPARRSPRRRRRTRGHARCDWGCTSTSSFSAAMPNICMASISSRPLFIRLAESMVTFGPIAQLGWASACSGVAAAICSALHVRNGPPEAVSHIFSTLSTASPPSAWKMALCSQSIGRTLTPVSRAVRMKGVAGADETFLVGERDVDARPRPRHRSARRRPRRRSRRPPGRRAGRRPAPTPPVRRRPRSPSPPVPPSIRRRTPVRRWRRSARRALWRPGRDSWRRGRPRPPPTSKRPGAPSDHRFGGAADRAGGAENSRVSSVGLSGASVQAM